MAKLFTDSRPVMPCQPKSNAIMSMTYSKRQKMRRTRGTRSDGKGSIEAIVTEVRKISGLDEKSLKR